MQFPTGNHRETYSTERFNLTLLHWKQREFKSSLSFTLWLTLRVQIQLLEYSWETKCMQLHAGGVCLLVPPSSHSKSASTWTYPQATPWTDTFQLPAHWSPPCMSTQSFMLWNLSYLAFIRILFTFFSIKKTSADVSRTHLCLYFILTHLSSFSLFIKMHHFGIFWSVFLSPFHFIRLCRVSQLTNGA